MTKEMHTFFTYQIDAGFFYLQAKKYHCVFVFKVNYFS